MLSHIPNHCQHIAAAKCVVSKGQAGQNEQCQTDYRQL